MAVAFDSTTSGTINYPQNPVSFSHSLGDGSGNDRIVFVYIAALGGSSHVFDYCTYDGQAMTQLVQIQSDVFASRS